MISFHLMNKSLSLYLYLRRTVQVSTNVVCLLFFQLQFFLTYVEMSMEN